MSDEQPEQECEAVLADIRSRAADRLERLEAEEAKTKELRAQLAVLRKGLQGEVESYRRHARGYEDDVAEVADATADRLQALLDSSGGEK